MTYYSVRNRFFQVLSGKLYGVPEEFQQPVIPNECEESFEDLPVLDRWGHLADTHRFEMVTDERHEWVYHAKIIQKNRRVEVDAVITRVEESSCPALWAEGYLKVNGLFIYQMKNFGLKLVRI